MAAAELKAELLCVVSKPFCGFLGFHFMQLEQGLNSLDSIEITVADRELNLFLNHYHVL